MSALKPCPAGCAKPPREAVYDGGGVFCPECAFNAPNRAAWNRRTAPGIDREIIRAAFDDALGDCESRRDRYDALDAAITEFQRQTGATQ